MSEFLQARYLGLVLTITAVSAGVTAVRADAGSDPAPTAKQPTGKQPTGKQPTGKQPSAEQLVERLGSPSFVKREEAILQLRILGGDALPALRQGLKSKDLEVRVRCGRLVELLETPSDELALDRFIRSGQPAIAGWRQFSKVFKSTSEATRELFVRIYRVDKQLLVDLENNPARASDLILDRYRLLSSKRNPAHVYGIVYAAACLDRHDARSFIYLSSALSRGDVRATITEGSPFAKLLDEICLRAPRDDNDFYRLTNLAAQHPLPRLSKVLKEAFAERVEEVRKSRDFNGIHRLIGPAQQLGLANEIETRIKPMVHEHASAVARGKFDYADFSSVCSIARSLQMDNTLHGVLKPSFLKTLEKLPLPTAQDLHRLNSIAYSLDVREEVHDAFLSQMLNKANKALARPSEQGVSELRVYASVLQGSPVVEQLMKAAATQVVIEKVAKSASAVALQQTYHFARQFNLTTLDETHFKPGVLKLSDQMAAEKDVNLQECQTIVSLSQSLGVFDKIKKKVAPALKKVFAKKGPFNSSDASRALTLARYFELAEGHALALRFARDKTLPSYTRVMSLQYVGKTGGKDDIAQIKSLLDDRSNVGAAILQGVRLDAQVRDVALGTIVHLSGKKLAEFGFEYARSTGQPYVSIPSGGFGFVNDQKRQEAFERWAKASGEDS